jgi:large subunit ribosomal protein L5
MSQARLKRRYEDEIRPELIRRFAYSTPMQAPVIQKITVNMGVGDAKQDSKALDAATEQLATIAGQRPNVRRARKSVAAFKLREGMPVGISVTLRGERGYEFLDRLMSVAIPRIRDFRGMNPRSFDGRGNYSMGVREQIIFPEIDYDSIDQTRGLDITITTSAKTDLEAFALLEAFGFPFARPEATPAAAPAGAGRAAAAEAAAAAAAVEETAAAEDAAEAEAVAAEELAVDEVAEELVEELVAEELVEEVAEELVAELVAEELVLEEVAAELAEEPAAEEPAAEEPAAEEPAAEEPAAVAEEPAAEVSVESVTETGSDSDPTAESPSSENAAERSAEEPDPDAQEAAEPAPDAPNDQE